MNNRNMMRIAIGVATGSILRIFAHAWPVLALLTITTQGMSQTVDWWDRSGETWQTSRPNASQVVATPYGIYSVGDEECETACKGRLSKYEADGTIAWQVLSEIGDLGTYYHGVAADENGIYVVGTAIITDPRPDKPNPYFDTWQTAFVQKYTHDGAEVWRSVDWFDGPPGHRIRNSVGCSIVIDDTGIYTTTGHWYQLNHGCPFTRNTSLFLRKLSFDGELMWLGGYANAVAVGDGRVFTDSATYSADGEFLGYREGPYANIPEHGLTYHDGALYFCSVDRFGGSSSGPAQVDVYKTDLEGNVAWHVAYPRSVQKAGRSNRQACAMTADSSGVYLASNLEFRGKKYRPGLSVRQWDFSGKQTAIWDFPSVGDTWDPYGQPSPSLGDPMPFAVSVLDGAVYVSGHDPEWNASFTARVSGDALLPPQAVSLADSGRLAVLDHEYGRGSVSLAIQRMDGTGDPQRLAFSNGLRPIDVFLPGNLGGTNAEDIGLLSRKPAVVEIIDSQSGEQILSINLDEDFEPIAATTAMAGGSPVVAVLMKHQERANLRVEEFDALTGDSLRTIPYNATWEPLDIVVLGQGADRRYGVLQANPEPDKLSRLEIRDTHGMSAVNVALGAKMVPQQALVYADDGERVAVLRRNGDLTRQDIAIVDPDAGTIVQTVAFNPQYTTSDFVHSPDIDLNLAPQFSAAGRRDSDGKVKAETRDLSGYVLHNVFLTPDQPIQDIVYFGQASGAATPSLGLLIRTRADFAIVMVDLLTGEKTGNLEFQF